MKSQYECDNCGIGIGGSYKIKRQEIRRIEQWSPVLEFKVPISFKHEDANKFHTVQKRLCGYCFGLLEKRGYLYSTQYAASRVEILLKSRKIKWMSPFEYQEFIWRKLKSVV